MANQDTSQNPLNDNSAIIQLIVFRAGTEEFGVSIDMVREIIKRNIITNIPNSPDFIKGIINVRGEIVTAIDMKLLFSLPQTNDSEAKHVIVTKHGDSLFGLLVDEVIEVLRIQKKEIKQRPNLTSKTDAEYIKGVISHDNRLIILLDLNQILSHKDISEPAASKKIPPKSKRAKESIYEKDHDY